MILLSLGERLKNVRKSRGLTQEALADLIGTSRGVITNLEHNKVETPQPLILNAICNALEVSQEWLISGNGNMDNTKVIKSAKVLSEIYDVAKDLTEDEQLYILDIIKSYRKLIEQKENS